MRCPSAFSFQQQRGGLRRLLLRKHDARALYLYYKKRKLVIKYVLPLATSLIYCILENILFSHLRNELLYVLLLYVLPAPPPRPQDSRLTSEGPGVTSSSSASSTPLGLISWSCNVRKCRNKLDFTLKPLLQSPHTNGRSPVKWKFIFKSYIYVIDS